VELIDGDGDGDSGEGADKTTESTRHGVGLGREFEGFEVGDVGAAVDEETCILDSDLERNRVHGICIGSNISSRRFVDAVGHESFRGILLNVFALTCFAEETQFSLQRFAIDSDVFSRNGKVVYASEIRDGVCDGVEGGDVVGRSVGEGTSEVIQGRKNFADEVLFERPARVVFLGKFGG